MAAPSPAEIQYQLRHIHDDQSDQIIAAFGVCLGFAVIAVLLRFVARHLTRAPLGGDDWTTLVGLVGPSRNQLTEGHWWTRQGLTDSLSLQIFALGYIVGQSVGMSPP